MKKITFFLVAFAASTMAFAQATMTLNTINGQTVADFWASNGRSIYQGQSLTYNITFTGLDEASRTGALGTQLTSQINGAHSDNTGATMNGKDRVFTDLLPQAADQTLDIIYPIGTDIILDGSNDITINLVNFFRYGGGQPNVNQGNILIFKDQAAQNVYLASLSSDAFNNTKLEEAYYSERSIIIGSISGAYSIYNIAGSVVSEGVISGNINVEDLTSGVYILATEAGVLKFIK